MLFDLFKVFSWTKSSYKSYFFLSQKLHFSRMRAQRDLSYYLI